MVRRISGKIIFVMVLMLLVVSSDSNAQHKKKSRAKKGKATRSKTTGTVQTRQNELKKIQSAIIQTRKQVKQLSTKEASTQKTLSLYQKQSSQISQHVTILGEEIHSLQDSINSMVAKQTDLEKRLKNLQDTYGKISREIHKHRAETENTGSPIAGNSSAPGEESKIYLKHLTSEMTKTAKSIRLLQDSISRQKNATAQTTQNRENLLHLKENQQEELGATISARKKELRKIRANKVQLQQELANKERAAREVKQMVSRLIEQAARREKERQRARIARKESEKNSNKNQKSSSSKYNNASNNDEPVQSNFAGKFHWPVNNSHKILRGFGQYRNSLSNSIMDNPGIDIQASEGSSASAAASGTVSLVHWLPGYSSLVIIDHGNNYRTVYANLSSTQVRQGQEIKQGEILGKTGESVDGEFLHFEVWRGRQRVNPVGYLGR
ncbi:MAG: peptidoglycan DD-metalloendopeptidase family protein [Bacteroidetes bacterium]|nr:peptidoglycan DD-metalloendopeptidase family protein [Bacteroidota bacterium]